jgi:hypothetical protein
MANWQSRSFRRRYAKSYYRKNRRRLLEYDRTTRIARRKASPKKRRAYNRRIQRWKQLHPRKWKLWRLKWYHKNRGKLREKGREASVALKRAVIAAYGGKCKCCGEKEESFLCVDHVRNDGKRHFGGPNRKYRMAGSILYRWLKKKRFPKKRFQLLCCNCNQGKKICGVCPHKK